LSSPNLENIFSYSNEFSTLKNKTKNNNNQKIIHETDRTFAVILEVLSRIDPEDASVSKPAESNTLNRKSLNLATPSRTSRVT
jgi:hypothetical protein